MSLLSGLLSKSKTLENITGLFVGENSKKRNIGFAGFAVTVAMFQMDYIDETMFDTLILACAGWTGIAFSNKLTKLGETLKDTKKKKK